MKLPAPVASWMRLVTTPSVYLLLLALIVTSWAKLHVVGAMTPRAGSWLDPLVVLQADVAVLFALAALFATAERYKPTLRWFTTPVAAMVLLVSSVNAAALTITGEQISREAFALGVDRIGAVWGITSEQVRANGVGLPVLLAVAAILFPFIVRRFLPSPSEDNRPASASRTAIASLAVPAAVAAVVGLALPAPRSPAVRQLATNATWGLLRDDGSPLGETLGDITPTDGVPRSPLESVPDPDLKPDPATTSPSIVLFVLESARYDHTSLPDPHHASQAETPNILALARRGSWARRARATVPHTTKSLFSILCGRMPMLQRALTETTAHVTEECLPRRLSRSGYRTAFIQSAVGAFEDRPRLVDNLGFEHFEAWEDVQGEPLGYFASDDESLAGAAASWLDDADGDTRPFFITLLTSSTHHPYRLPRRSDRTGMDEHQRFVRLLETQDGMIGNVLADLKRRGVLDETIVIVVGDHGEGFGDRGVRQHDNNFYEEGLHVPLVLSGPGVPVGAIDHNVSLMDVAPTVLDLLGNNPTDADDDPRLGRSLYATVDPERRLYFACYYDGYCYGYVQGDLKVISQPRDRESFYFDLASDPAELNPLALSPAMQAAVAGLPEFVLSTRLHVEDPVRAENSRYGQWVCPRDDPCRHPLTPDGVLFDGSTGASKAYLPATGGVICPWVLNWTCMIH